MLLEQFVLELGNRTHLYMAAVPFTDSEILDLFRLVLAKNIKFAYFLGKLWFFNLK